MIKAITLSNSVMSLQGKHQSDNASLAVQACRMWLEERSSSQVSAGPASPKIIGSEAEPFPIPDLFKQGTCIQTSISAYSFLCIVYNCMHKCIGLEWFMTFCNRLATMCLGWKKSGV